MDDDSPDGTAAALRRLARRDARVRVMQRMGRRGLASFMAVCSVGAVANVGSASYLFEHVTGWAVAGVAGILIGAVWNYAVTGAYTWGGRRSRAS